MMRRTNGLAVGTARTGTNGCWHELGADAPPATKRRGTRSPSQNPAPALPVAGPNELKLSDRGWRGQTWNTKKSPSPVSVRWSAWLGRGVLVGCSVALGSQRLGSRRNATLQALRVWLAAEEGIGEFPGARPVATLEEKDEPLAGLEGRGIIEQAALEPYGQGRIYRLTCERDHILEGLGHDTNAEARSNLGLDRGGDDDRIGVRQQQVQRVRNIFRIFRRARRSGLE